MVGTGSPAATPVTTPGLTPATAAPAPLAVRATSDALRYIASNKGGSGFMLWTSRTILNECTNALARGTERDRKVFCEDGAPGIKPKVGEVPPGTEVELLDSRECGTDMAHIRVLDGSFRGETGCIATIGLTRIKSN